MDKVLVSGAPRLYNRHPSRITYCPGCQHPSIERLLCEVIGELEIEDRVIAVSGVGCFSRINLVIDVDACQPLHGRAPDMATGIKRALLGKPIVFTIQGDGDCAAIGAGSLIAAAVRGEKLTILMLNNTNYGTTGGQMAPTTLVGQVTTTSPEGREPNAAGYPFHVPEVLAGMKGVVYTARGALTTPANYQRTKGYIKKAFQKQIDNIGFSFVEVLVACPANWRLSPVDSIKRIEREVIPEFPLGEFKDIDKIS